MGIARLRRLGRRRQDQAFRHNVGRAILLPESLTIDLTDLGVNSIGHRRKLLAFPYLRLRRWDAVWVSTGQTAAARHGRPLA
jgi:hypothetical protein